jgi:cytochrome c-type biogenesis protein CcmE
MRIGFASVLIVGTIGWLAFSGYGANKSYYVTIAELGGMGDKAYHSQLRVEGFVVPGSIETNGPHVTFMLNEFESHSPKAPTGKQLKVTYAGSEPPPDTFKDDSMALAEGSYGRDGVFRATRSLARRRRSRTFQARHSLAFRQAREPLGENGVSVEPGIAGAKAESFCWPDRHD